MMYGKNAKYLFEIPKSAFKIYRKSEGSVTAMSKKTNQKSDRVKISPICVESDYRENSFKIQMISKNLHRQIFGNSSKNVSISEELISQHKDDLKHHGITIDNSDAFLDIPLKLPPLRGENIEEHFMVIAKEQLQPYSELIKLLVNCSEYPSPPAQWKFCEGWTQYNPRNQEFKTVDYPDEDGIIMDVEVCMSAGSAPSLATAVSTSHWYSWVSPQMFVNGPSKTQPTGYTLDDLIPLGKAAPKLIVGHNVSYDRARIREQYYSEDTLMRFIDTMALHICVSGVTSYQRSIMKSKKEKSYEDSEWIKRSSLNNLADVYKLYCKGSMHSKTTRDIFKNGELADVRKDFQNLMSYCANDVIVTKDIFRKLYPIFADRFPHPVTLAGMLELGSAYLPVNSNWLRFINEAKLAYEDLNIEAKCHLSMRAKEACHLLIEEHYKNNLWLWDEDWSVQELKMKKSKTSKKNVNTAPIPELLAAEGLQVNRTNDKAMEEMQQKAKYYHKFKKLYATKTLLPLRRPLMPGYPGWYRKLCQKPQGIKQERDVDWTPGVPEIGTGMQIAPKLLSLCWEGFPLHYTKEHGWGFLVPFPPKNLNNEYEGKIPIKELYNQCPIHSQMGLDKQELTVNNLRELYKEIDLKLYKKDYYIKTKKLDLVGYKGAGIWCNTLLDDAAFFFKLPHPKGSSFRVGNPLSREFLSKISENVLSSGNNDKSAERTIKIARMMSYWKNNRDRITNQMVVWLPMNQMKNSDLYEPDKMQWGAICPQVVVCGTLTRRAMEPTWMTAANSQLERVGSELRAMVQAPRSYKIIGADVDSQELWIASVLGDAYSCGEHGATPLGWMTLSGLKSNRTDMHSLTAKAVGISREHAKVLNYARIYGAGHKFAEGLLKQYNPSFSERAAKEKATKMYIITKGRKSYEIRNKFRYQFPHRSYTGYEAKKISSNRNLTVDEMFYKSFWKGGTESAMFNRLEEIALSNKPKTPFLGGRLSRPLETEEDVEARFLPTRVNWVVQSGAVDFLHLMLVSMRWLMGSRIRLCLSFHDELRYLAKDEVAYKAALAMHITNLLTRSFCSSRLGINDLPMSVAFFSSVEVDTVLRKECTMDCKTPSNPQGLLKGYGIPHGESLNIYKAIAKSGGGNVSEWNWLN